MSRFREGFHKGPFVLRRVGRRVFWSRPELYRWLGVARGRGDCLRNGYDVWIGGYPRSANTFAMAAFKLANPSASIASHFHIPAFIIHGLQLKKPGILLIRRPIESVVSWTIYWEGRMKLEHSLDYYLDFHQALMPYKSELFIAAFDETTQDFPQVMLRFNHRFGTQYGGFSAKDDSVGNCLAIVDDLARSADGTINELTVSRPSARRGKINAELTKRLQDSERLAHKLKVANQLYDTFYSIGKEPKPSRATCAAAALSGI